MVHKYVEITEDESEYNPLTDFVEYHRIPVATDEEAIVEYDKYKGNFTKVKANVVDGDHVSGGNSKPCNTRKIKEDGTLDPLVEEVIDPIEE